MTFAADSTPIGVPNEDQESVFVLPAAPPLPEPEIKTYPGWVCAVIWTTGAIGGWLLLYAGYRYLGGAQVPFLPF